MLSSPNLAAKTQQYFVTSSDMFLDEKTLLKIWLNPLLNLTIFRGTGPRSEIDMYVSYWLNKVYNEADVDNDDDDDDDDDDDGYGGGSGDDDDDDDNDGTLNLPRNFFFMSTGNSKNTSQKFLMTGW